MVGVVIGDEQQLMEIESSIRGEPLELVAVVLKGVTFCSEPVGDVAYWRCRRSLPRG
jgi:hypothetical protein